MFVYIHSYSNELIKLSNLSLPVLYGIRASVLTHIFPMASDSTYSLPNSNDPSTPFIPNAIKLTTTNYLSWKLQLTSLLCGHNLIGYWNSDNTPPHLTIQVDNTTKPNPVHATWFRQDQLLFGALVRTLSPNLIPLISQAITSKALWDTLTGTFHKINKGHIKQKKDQLKAIIKGNNSITYYMQSIKVITDELASLGKPIDHEDIIDRGLEGLDGSYEQFVGQINARDSAISFEELHEKLITKELNFKKINLVCFFCSSHCLCCIYW